MADITIETIKKGLRDNDSWVSKAILALADNRGPNVIARRRFHEYRDELKSFGAIEDLGSARRLCILHAEALLAIATAPAFDFKGKTFVLTGKLDNYTRDQLTSKLEGLGAYVTGSVSRNTDILIVGSKPGAKFRAAQHQGIPMWNEDELVENMKPPSKK